MRKKLNVAAALIVLLMLLAAGCGTTHTTIADARQGESNDRIDISEAIINTDPQVIFRQFASDLLQFEVCDRAGDCMFIDVSQGNIEYERGMFVSVTGTLRFDDTGEPYGHSAIASRLTGDRVPTDWPN